MLVTHVNFLFGNSGIRRNVTGERRRRRRALQLKLPACACVSTTLLISARVNCECNTWTGKKNEKGREKKGGKFAPRTFTRRVLISSRSIGINRCIVMASVSRNAFNYIPHGITEPSTVKVRAERLESRFKSWEFCSLDRSIFAFSK